MRIMAGADPGFKKGGSIMKSSRSCTAPKIPGTRPFYMHGHTHFKHYKAILLGCLFA